MAVNAKIPRKRASALWSYFTILSKEKSIARCHICHRVFSFKTTISNLKKHVERKHPNEDLLSYIHEERVNSGSEGMLEVPDKGWKHLTDHEYMLKKDSKPEKGNTTEEGQVELEFLQDIAIADVQDVVQEQPQQQQQQPQQNNLTELKPIPSSNPLKKYLKFRKIPFHFNRQRLSGNTFTVHNLESNVQCNRTTPSKPACTEDDEFERFGRHVAAQLRQLPLHSSLLVQESIQSLITRERIASLDVAEETIVDGATYEEVQDNE